MKTFRHWFLTTSMVLGVAVIGACGAPEEDEPQAPATGMEAEPAAEAPAGADVAGGQKQTLADDGKPLNATFAGASAQGTFSVIGEGLAEMVRRQYPGSSLGYEPGSNAGALARIMSGQSEFSFVSTVMARRADDGVEPFEQKLPVYEQIGTIFPPVTMVAYVIARQDFLKRHGIEDFADLREKKVPVRISLNQKGNVEVYHTARAILEAYDISEKDISDWGGEIFYVPSSTYTDMIKDNKLDVIITVGYYPDRRVREMQEATAVTFMPINAEVRENVARQFDLEPAAIPSDAYDFLDEDYDTIQMTLWIIAGPAAEDLEVYKFTKAVHNNLDYFRGLHPLFRGFQEDMMVRHEPFRLHPAAAAYYREAGLLPSEDD